MKTKVNEIPLVGPKGRSELIKRINESNENIENVEYTIAQALNDLNDRIAALESAPAPVPETHILEILSLSEGQESEADTLARLKFDGGSVTLQMLFELDITKTSVKVMDSQFAILALEVWPDNNHVHIVCGYVIPNIVQMNFEINIYGDASFISIYD